MKLRDLPITCDNSFVSLQAHCHRKNIARSWQLDVRSDLFGWIIVTWQWGRIGRCTTTKSAAFADADHAQRFARKLLARRDSAPNRIGVPYVTVEV